MSQLPSEITLTDVEAEEARRGHRSLHFFLRVFAWPALNPATPFHDNWHIGAICDHLEAVARGEIKRLIINMPFRMLKSTIVSQAFPAWDWTNRPSREFLTASYAGDVAMRDAVDARRIIESDGYQKAYGSLFSLTTDQNVKTRYENDKRGRRTVISTDSKGTGFGGDIRIVDDPVSAKQADSPLEIAKSREWWKGTMVTRANDQANGPAVIVHQRLNSNDLTGYLLAEETGWEHLVLPMRFDPELRKTTCLGFMDPRQSIGELLQPARLPEDTVAALERSLGKYHTDAQLQQNPAPRSGIIFARKDWKFWKALPELDETVISVDCTFKDLESSDYVAIQAWGRKGANHYLRRRLKERLSFSATVDAIRSFSALFADHAAILIEDKANGSAVIETLQSQIGGIIPVNPEGGKVARAYAMQPEQEAGNVWLPDSSVEDVGGDIEVFLTEASGFPGAPNDDEVDAMTQYVNWARKRIRASGFSQWVKEQADAVRRERDEGANAR
jgi:predicted phage terminase large subunit-like protein